MTKHYWDEYLNVLLDHNEINRILKFHQSNVPVIDQNQLIKSDINKLDWIELNKDIVISSDIVLKKYSIAELCSSLKSIYKLMKKQFEEAKIPLILPVFTVLPKFQGVESGCYTFNFQEESLIKYKELPNSESISLLKNKNIDICLSFFLNLERSTFLYEGLGYLKGILQIGEFSGTLITKLNLESKDIFIQPQTFTHDLGINLRKQILIKNECLIL